MTYKYETRQGSVTTTTNQTYNEFVPLEEGGYDVVVRNHSDSSANEVVRQVLSFTSSSSNGNRRDPNTYQYTKYEENYGHGSTDQSIVDAGIGFQNSNTSGPGVNYGYPSYSSSQPPPDMGEVINSALSSLLNQIRGGVDLSVDIAQAGQTRKMLSDAGRLQAKILSISPKIWAKRWLQYQYGWKPLASTLYESASRVIKQDYSGFTALRGRAKSVVRQDDVTEDRYSGSYREISYRAQYGARFNLDASRLGNVVRWTSLNPLSIAWELLPYSFVVDWFIDIGTYVRDLESAMVYGAIPIERGYLTTTTRDHEQFLLNEYIKGPPGGVNSTKKGSGWRRTTTLNRTLISALPLPQPPRVKANLGSERLLSAASLLALHLK